MKEFIITSFCKPYDTDLIIMNQCYKVSLQCESVNFSIIYNIIIFMT